MLNKQFAALLIATSFVAPAFADEHAHGDATVAQGFIKRNSGAEFLLRQTA
jgi:hypothetical protein